MKIFVLTIIDLQDVGYCPKDVEVFTTREDAGKRMRELYIKYAEKAKIENPFDGQHTIDYQFAEDCYASVWDYCYLDIWEREIGEPTEKTKNAVEPIVVVEETAVIAPAEENYLIDREGKPYTEESWPAGGGLDKRCDYNDLALHCYYDKEDMESIHQCLKEEGFDDPIHSDEGMEIWEKGNTRIVFECYVNGMWGYLHTEYIETTTPAEDKTPKLTFDKQVEVYGFKHYEIPTEYAKKSIETNKWDDSYDDTDVEWWKVAVLPNGDEIWEDNALGMVLILTKGDTSYMRYI